ncbi:MAG: UTP--glucose-1-phosphate uridylyltransferase [Alphaproteobacteria bacterium]|nr:UTP--glucose-1-phosphate uridylyltransferase [Alphaproteobacteria bacterium]
MKPIRKAVFPVAGLGTRILPATKSMPKEMLTIVDKPLIQYAVDEARAAGIETFIFVTGRGKDSIEDHFDLSYEMSDTLEKRGKTTEQKILAETVPPAGDAIFVRQQRPLGLGHAVWCARKIVGDEPFAVLLPDELIEGATAELVEAYQATGGNLVSVLNIPREQTGSYGVIAPGAEANGRIEVTGLVEKPKPAEAPSTLMLTGRYVLQPEIFAKLEDQKPGAGNEIQLTDAMARLIGEQPFHAVPIGGARYDCGSKAGFLVANLVMGLKRPDIAPALKTLLKESGIDLG